MTEAAYVLIVEARFYEDIADELVRGALAELERWGASHDRVPVPGTFEIPAAIAFAVRAAESVPGGRRYDAYVALGCVIRGETTHYDYVCQESARGLAALSRDHALALGYGILTCENRDQAWARANLDQGNKGGVAAAAAMEMLALKRHFGLSG